MAIGALYAKINSHGKDLNDHKVYIAEEITKRPDFDHLHEEIEKAEKRGCGVTNYVWGVGAILNVSALGGWYDMGIELKKTGAGGHSYLQGFSFTWE